MNSVNLVGYVANEIALKTTKNGKTFVNFAIGINGKQTQFIQCCAWSPIAENLEKHVKKGNKIGISGHLVRVQNKDKNGNMIYSQPVQVDYVDFFSRNTDEQKTEFSTPSVEDVEGTDDFPF